MKEIFVEGKKRREQSSASCRARTGRFCGRLGDFVSVLAMDKYGRLGSMVDCYTTGARGDILLIRVSDVRHHDVEFA
jgi:hypothetical protein